MLQTINVNQSGYFPCTYENGAYAFTRMDTGLHAFEPGQSLTWRDEAKEAAFLLLSGAVEFCLGGASYSARRADIFRQDPYCMHVPCGQAVTIRALEATEILLIATTNPADFSPVFYTPDMVKSRYLGDDTLGGTARRLIRDIFDYDNAPYSNLVVGEIINLPGRWSSYPPHWHRQPEIYFYKFDKPQGFGACFMGDNAYSIRHNSFAAIPGGLCHPQCTAPGYAMYYAWIIRHLENDPWNERNYAPEHDWLNQPGADIIDL